MNYSLDFSLEAAQALRELKERVPPNVLAQLLLELESLTPQKLAASALPMPGAMYRTLVEGVDGDRYLVDLYCRVRGKVIEVGGLHYRPL